MTITQSVSAERIERGIRELAQFSTEGAGVTRLSYTPEHAAARDMIISAMRQAKLDVSEDALGNITGRREGIDPDLPAIAVGSHFDSVRNGGMFDGSAGVICALEAARVVNDSDYENRHPFEFLAIVEEEGARFNSGLLGGRALAGLVADEDLDTLRDTAGVSVRRAATDFGLRTESLETSARSRRDLRAFIELHIEQGPVLEREGVDIGVVTSIVGVQTLHVVVEGRSDHAGTTPMHLRKDALLPAAQMVREVNRLVTENGDETVATVGHFTVAPGGTNQVPGNVSFTLDIRSPREESLRQTTERITKMIRDIASDSDVETSVEGVLALSPVPMAPSIVDTLRNASSDLNFSHRDMPSGAGHDSMFIAQITDVGMIFVPSREGRSHVPEEWTDFNDLRKGTEVMLKAIQMLDGLSSKVV